MRVNSIFNFLSNRSYQVLSFQVFSGFFGFSGRVTSSSGFFGFGFGSGRVGILNPLENSSQNASSIKRDDIKHHDNLHNYGILKVEAV